MRVAICTSKLCEKVMIMTHPTVVACLFRSWILPYIRHFSSDPYPKLYKMSVLRKKRAAEWCILQHTHIGPRSIVHTILTFSQRIRLGSGSIAYAIVPSVNESNTSCPIFTTRRAKSLCMGQKVKQSVGSCIMHIVVPFMNVSCYVYETSGPILIRHVGSNRRCIEPDFIAKKQISVPKRNLPKFL